MTLLSHITLYCFFFFPVVKEVVFISGNFDGIGYDDDLGWRLFSVFQFYLREGTWLIGAHVGYHVPDAVELEELRIGVIEAETSNFTGLLAL
jgi:hypothetical protein